MIEVPQPATTPPPARLEAVVLDWAGTTVDFGSRAPIAAIQAAFAEAEVEVSEAEARAPMGRAKRDHLQALLDMPSVSERWTARHGRTPTESDLDTLYSGFLVRQAECVVEHSAVIDGCVAAIAACRDRGLRIGSSTGYTRDLLDRVAVRAEHDGYAPEVRLSADDVAPGRPAPWLCYENARRLGVYPMAAVAKVDDTPAGIQAGRNAGCWCVGVVASGNEVGLSLTELNALPTSERDRRLEQARERLIAAGSHLLIDTIAELPTAVDRINQWLAAGRKPD